ncbi:hypothetical protein [Streptomyces sp. NPDC047028]|uniref:hypothetical protein n=1 Tax=Streptomyces sp. NPDC047028 TaxID=3155793 RepID=UPI0033FC14A8
MRSSSTRRTGLAAVVAAGALVAGIAPATAATGTAAHGVRSAAACKVKVKAWGYTGYRMCGAHHYWSADWNHDKTRDEVFVIAPNREIWHVWANAGGWKEMPGNGHGDRLYDWSKNGSHRCVSVVANGAGVWKNVFGGHSWSGWKRGTCR